MSSSKRGEQKSTPPNFGKILVAFDGSECATKAFKAGVELAQKMGSTLIIVEVVGIPVYYLEGEPGLPPVDISQYLDSARKAAGAQLERLVEEAKSRGVAASSDVLEQEESAAQTIIDRAVSEKADMIVIGSRGLGRFKKLLLGSVSSAVVSHAECPVLVVR